MIRALLAAELCTSALALPAKAQDPRLVDRLYDPEQVVRIEGKANVQATIKFGPDEFIENVAIGDSRSWQITPNKRANLLFVKPLAERAATNMTVVTNLHTYLFDLVASPKVEAPLYVLSFSYPKELQPEPLQPAEQASEAEMAAATDPYAVVDPAELNFAWKGSGDANLLPTSIYDDGEATFLAWPAERVVPAILVKNREGVEGPVNFAVRGDLIVVDGVPHEVVLRAGDDTAQLVNQGPPRPERVKQSALAQAGEINR